MRAEGSLTIINDSWGFKGGGGGDCVPHSSVGGGEAGRCEHQSDEGGDGWGGVVVGETSERVGGELAAGELDVCVLDLVRGSYMRAGAHQLWGLNTIEESGVGGVVAVAYNYFTLFLRVIRAGSSNDSLCEYVQSTEIDGS
ncbi:hypothetical protein Tco_0662460 [Tanacetum coccineum]